MPKVLYVCHNHPTIRPGGVETYALELYEGMRTRGEFEPVLLAKAGRPLSMTDPPHRDTLLARVNDDPNQYFLYTDHSAYDYAFGTSRDKELYTKHFHAFLAACRPDMVHFQHTHLLGFDLIRQTRNTLPDAPIVYTLHEYLPICHREGQMVRSDGDELCVASSPRRCHECFPDISPATFFARKRFIQSHLSLVDLFLAPSRFLLERFVDWGIPAEKIRYEEYGRRMSRRPVDPTAEGPADEDRPRNRLGFFGQFSPFKGLSVLLKAMCILRDETKPRDSGRVSGPRRTGARIRSSGETADGPLRGVHLWLHGANLELQPKAFQQEFSELLEAAGPTVTLVGRYGRAELPALMANINWVVVPSIWWENSPLVIQEAFLHGRPVICSAIGAMAEKVTDGVNGLHFRAGDPIALAETIRRAVSSPSLWGKLRSGAPAVYRMEDHVATLTRIYRELLGRTASRA